MWSLFARSLIAPGIFFFSDFSCHRLTKITFNIICSLLKKENDIVFHDLPQIFAFLKSFFKNGTF